jgi:hypothetical protein
VKQKLLLAISLLALAALLSVGYAPAQNASADKLITVLNPIVESKMVERLPLSPRLDTLEGKTIYMVDINWGGPDAAYSMYEEMTAWFAQNIPSVKTVLRRVQGSYSQDQPELWKEIAAKGNAAIVGISG